MKTFFSIISIQTNSFSLEKVVVGLLAITENEIYFEYSKNKLQLLDKLAPSHHGISQFAKKSLQQIKNKVVETNQVNHQEQQKISYTTSVFSKEYIDYLSKYSNGVLSFSKPEGLPEAFTYAAYEKYFYNFVGEVIPTTIKKEALTFAKKIKPYFEKKGLENKADLKYHFKPNTFKGILKEADVTMITKNGAISAFQAVDFNLGEQTVVNHLYETKIIQDALQNFSAKNKTKVNKIKIAFEEPKLHTPQHQLFDLSLQNYKEYFDFITPDILEKDTEVICNSNNIKFSDYLQTLEI